MDPSILNIEAILAAYATGAEGRYTKDAAHVAAFVVATAKKVLELGMAGQVDQIPAFAHDSGKLVADWANAIHRLSLHDLFTDPFRPLREETRVFAKAHSLDPALIAALG